MGGLSSAIKIRVIVGLRLDKTTQTGAAYDEVVDEKRVNEADTDEPHVGAASRQKKTTRARLTGKL
jgi:hypothetical protein